MEMELTDYLPREDALAILTLSSSLELHYSLPPSSVSRYFVFVRCYLRPLSMCFATIF